MPSEEEADEEKNEECYAELIQLLDDTSLSLVMRDAAGDGRKALKILRDHYASQGKPRIIALYTELTSLEKGASETVTDYLIRAERSITALKNAKETLSDLPPPQALLIESSNRCGRKFRDAQAVLTLAGKARKRLLNNASFLGKSVDFSSQLNNSLKYDLLWGKTCVFHLFAPFPFVGGHGGQ